VFAALSGLVRRYSHINLILLDQVIVSGGNFLTGILLARTLGIEEFGRFTLAWMVVLFIQSIQYGAIIAPLMSLGPNQPDKTRPAYYGAVFTHQFLFAIVTALLALAIALGGGLIFPHWASNELILPLLAAILFSQTQDFLRRYLFTIERAHWSVIGDAIRYLGQIAALLALYTLTPIQISSHLALWVLALFAAISAVALLPALGKLDWSGTRLARTTREHWNFGKWLTGAEILEWAAGNVFIIAAGSLFGASAAGAMRACKTLLGALHILYHALLNFIPVRAAQILRDEGHSGLSRYLQRVLWVGGGATALAALTLSATPGFWVSTLFGEEYLAYAYMIKWYGLSYLLVFVTLIMQLGLRAVARTGPVFGGYAASAIYSVLVVYPLLHTFGLTGALIGLVTAPMVKLFIMVPTLFSRLAEPEADRGQAPARPARQK
jgi:O-antigen/teichoic acid export membrane protein